MQKYLTALILLTVAGSFFGTAQANESMRHEVRRSLDRGAEWLVSQQNTNGWWTTADHPAVTALVLSSLQGREGASKAELVAVEKGYAWLRSQIHEDGSIYGKKEMVNYNTAMSLTALAARGDRADHPAMIRAREYLIGTQIDMGEKVKMDSEFDGGVGYGSKYDHSDLANTVQALEAIRRTDFLVGDRPAAKELNWQAAIHFLERCQNLPSKNPEKWASDDAGNVGGFIYYPGKSMAGETNLPSGRVALRSYGSISYSGLLSLVYARLENNDPRVQAVLKWLGENYTIEENPGMGQQGLFYYLHAMAKALQTAGIDTLQRGGKTPVVWREELALRLFGLQGKDGSWTNATARWWEKEASLTSAYAILSLRYIESGWKTSSP